MMRKKDSFKNGKLFFVLKINKKPTNQDLPILSKKYSKDLLYHFCNKKL